MISLSDPGKENSLYQYELEGLLKTVLYSGQYILGENVKLFERKFADFCGSKHCASTANGTDALVIALKSLGCGANDKIITTPNGGFYSTGAIKAIGAIPIYVDICERTMAMSMASLKHALKTNKNVRCIIATHLYGAMVDIDKIAQLAADHGLLLLEDCAQAHGAEYNGKFAGTFGDAGTYSFYPTKNLGTIGDGGAIITNSTLVYENVLKIRQYGWDRKYEVVLEGGQNSRLDELHAAILRFKLSKLDALNAVRKDIVSRYAATQFKALEVFNIDGPNFVAHMAIVKTKHRDLLKDFLLANNIGCDVHYPILDYKQPSNYLEEVFCETAERVVTEILSIPCHPAMTDDEISYVISKLIEFDASI